MLIVDLNQTMISNLLIQIGNHQNLELDVSMVRHMVLNSIRSYRHRFCSQYGEMVIACDSRNGYWRKAAFPYYKANRKKVIDKSELDWKAIYECMSVIKDELKVYFPYKVIDVDGAEADDVIATLVKISSPMEKILILSGDKDFVQLQRFFNVDQYDPIRNRSIEHRDPKEYLRCHILKGDSGDGIPNILSADNAIVIGTRQRPMTKVRMEKWADPEQFKKDILDDPVLAANYKRNQLLIDLSNVPPQIEDLIVEQYNNQPRKDRSKLLNYFIANRLRNLMDSIQDF